MKRLYRKTRSRSLDLPSITLTPFIDTVLVLLVVFMVTSPGKIPLLQTSIQSFDQAPESIDLSQPKIITALTAQEQRALPKTLPKPAIQRVPDEPEAKALDKIDKQKYKALIIWLDAQGSIFVDGTAIKQSSLKSEIMRTIEKSPITTVRIQNDPGCSTSVIHKVIDTVRQIHGVKIVFW